ncbi:hypothetical protein FHS18_004289 [Paenibacillus phyllosphaerae]|uniref:Uncharacterized protein n=1 Tax=Paenibacillus phyllosphaerae TaxID=274593 RepID=A0A7W5B0J8_9BACL|nr:hypothetical protein [Paenibacillus phyllosphaerae]MBB3112203.1 hypothetical protein [Paenibacillus phyllosphaerae]
MLSVKLMLSGIFLILLQIFISGEYVVTFFVEPVPIMPLFSVLLFVSGLIVRERFPKKKRDTELEVQK